MTDQEFLEWLEQHVGWYESQSAKWNFVLAACRILSLAATITSIIGAAAMPAHVFGDWGRWVIIATSAMTAMSTEILSQMKVREMEELREDGNLEINAIYAYTKQRLAETRRDQQRRTKLMDEVRTKVKELERAQHKGFVAIDGKAMKQAARVNSKAAAGSSRPARRKTSRR